MTNLSDNTYIVGRIIAAKPTSEQASVLSCTTIETFSRLFKCGFIYHCRSYSHALTGKRRNTFCKYLSDDGSKQFGEIELFLSSPGPCALIRKRSPLSSTLLNLGGNPSRESLATYVQLDLLKHFLDLATSHHLEVVPLCNILSKAVFVAAFNRTYCV